MFSRNSSTGALTYVEAKEDGVGGVDGIDSASSVTVSPDGKHVYVTSDGDGMSGVDNAVTVFSRNSSTGALSFVETKKDGVGGVDDLHYARSVTVSPDGKHVYTAAFIDDAVTVFSRGIGQLSSPTNLALASNGTLSWNAPSTANSSTVVTEYTITSSGGTETTVNRVNGVTPSSVVNFGDPDCSSYSGYTVKVSKYSVGNTVSTAANPSSNPLNITKIGPAPAAPGDVIAAGLDGTAIVSWNKPFSYSGCPITSYTVTYDGKTKNTTGSPVKIEGLTNGAIYTFTVTATNEQGTSAAVGSAWAIPDTPETIPDPPINVSAIAGEGSAFISWDAPLFDGLSEISTYTVKTYPEGEAHKVTTSDTEFEITGLSNGTEYVFTVMATNKAGTGYESEASNSVIPATIPSAPINVVGVRGDSEVVVSWSPPDFNGGRPIDSYIVTSEPDAISHNTKDTSFRFPELSNGTEYTFSVLATNVVGSSPSSGISNGVTPATYPGSPREVFAEASDGRAFISWSPPDHDGGNPINSYLVTSYPGELEKTVQGPFATIDGLINGIEYTFNVSATNEVGTGYESETSNSIIPLTVPGQPIEIIATAGDSEVIVSWSPPDFDGGTDITNYIVTSQRGEIGAQTEANSISIQGLTNGTEYTFAVIAENLIGAGLESQYSNPVTPITFPATPLNITVTANGSEIHVAWSPPASDGGSPVTGYIVTSSPEDISITTENTSATFSELKNGTKYTFTVIAANDTGPGKKSEASNPVVPATYPGIPIDVTVEHEDSGALVSWSPPTSDGGNQITSYTVTSSTGDISVTTEETSILIEGLDDESEYTFTVTANNSLGSGDQSDISEVFTLPAAPKLDITTATIPAPAPPDTQPKSVEPVVEKTDNVTPKSDTESSSLVGRAVGDTGGSSSNMPLILIGIVIGSMVIIALGFQGYRRTRPS